MSGEIKQENEILDLAKFYFMNDKYEQAKENFEKVLQINPNNEQAYYNLGLIFEQSNENDKAKEMYVQALKIKNDYKSAQERLNKLIGLEDE